MSKKMIQERHKKSNKKASEQAIKIAIVEGEKSHNKGKQQKLGDIEAKLGHKRGLTNEKKLRKTPQMAKKPKRGRKGDKKKHQKRNKQRQKEATKITTKEE